MSSEQALLEAARAGDEGAFRSFVEPHRAELHAHCYRMLGSVHDAEDALQDALLRAWRGLGRFEGRSSLRSWLYRIATNVCLDRISQRPRRAHPVDYGPAADPDQGPGEPLIESTWVEPYPDERQGLQDGYATPEARYERRESVELAFIVALQQLPATQRAALILRDVLGLSAREVAETLDTTVASANGALRRARKAVAQRLPAQSQQANLRSLGDDGLRTLVERYIDAWERGDVNAIVAMLAEDATFAMPPLPTWYRGRDAIAAFLTRFALRDRWRLVPARANGQLAFGAYAWEPERSSYTPLSLDVLTLDGTRATDITSFVAPQTHGPEREQFATEIFDRFGLPHQLG
ncbi:MAG TPA: sigma-70 family RNA polymerase sigma factor [Acidimicrobiales bacterium]|nr:sigma-70 family RNA polymerase sigma factor [Acidimicrobiales bacterium]